MSKSSRMQVTQVIELLKQGRLDLLSEVPAELIQAAMAETGTANRSRTLGVKVYPTSGSIGITGIRTSPVVLYAGEWALVEKVMATEAFKAALVDPQASTGSDDPRFAEFRAESKAKRKAAMEARKA